MSAANAIAPSGVSFGSKDKRKFVMSEGTGGPGLADFMNRKGGSMMSKAKELVASQQSGSPSAITDLANAELAKVEATMQPQMDKLKDQVTSTKLVDDARSNTAALVAGAQGAATRSRSAAGVGGTTRQQALAAYQAKSDAAKAQVGTVNNAKLNQSKINEDAQSKLSELNTQLAQTAMSTKLDAAKADQSYQMHKENLATQKKNNKKAFWGKVGGTALGIGTALLI